MRKQCSDKVANIIYLLTVKLKFEALNFIKDKTYHQKIIHLTLDMLYDGLSCLVHTKRHLHGRKKVLKWQNNLFMAVVFTC